LAPDWLPRAANWTAEATDLAVVTAGPGLTVVADSFGCAAAARLAIDFPCFARRLLPARVRRGSVHRDPGAVVAQQAGACGPALDALLGGDAPPSVTDAELSTPHIGRASSPQCR
jgi:hypothetical protein